MWVQIMSSPGVVLASQFVVAESAKFSSYIDYIDRAAAVRNDAYQDYSAYMDAYMDNPDKQLQRDGFNPESETTSNIFTADSDQLDTGQKQGLKQQFQIAQKNGSVMWQNVISFDNPWLEQQGLYDSGSGFLDEARLKSVTRAAMRQMCQSENMQHSAVWSADIHYNTDNIHVHVAVVEPVPTREKMTYTRTETVDGKLVQTQREEYRGKLKPQTLDQMKSKAVNHIMDNSAQYKKINNIIRESIVQAKRLHTSAEDKQLQKDFLSLHRSAKSALPDNPKLWQYNQQRMQQMKPQLDAFSRKYMETYHRDDLRELDARLAEQQESLRRAYGSGKRQLYENYAQTKTQDLYTRLGNTVLKELQQYEESSSAANNKRMGVRIPERSAQPPKFGDAPSAAITKKTDLKRPQNIFEFLQQNVSIVDVAKSLRLDVAPIATYRVAGMPKLTVDPAKPERAAMLEQLQTAGHDIKKEPVTRYRLTEHPEIILDKQDNRFYDEKNETSGNAMQLIKRFQGGDNKSALQQWKSCCKVPIPNDYNALSFAGAKYFASGGNNLVMHAALKSGIGNLRRAMAAQTQQQARQNQREYQRMMRAAQQHHQAQDPQPGSDAPDV